MHTSVMLKEAIAYLNLKEDSKIVDCTLGMGGHSAEILKKVTRGRLFAFDQDMEAIATADQKLKSIGNNYKIIKTNFVNIKQEILKETDKVDGILYDLGVSSPQLDEADRGFSFHQEARLDMRMDKTQSLSAYEVVNNYDEQKLINIIRTYGEEKYAVSIVKSIIRNRPITTTLELVEVIKKGVSARYIREHHPARKTFQAIRIEVNNELEVFKKSLIDALSLLNTKGRVCVITFHSLEDKICKDIFKTYSSLLPELKKMPIVPDELQPKYKIIGAFLPSDEEIKNNNRARSAKLRVIERI